MGPGGMMGPGAGWGLGLAKISLYLQADGGRSGFLDAPIR